MKQHEYLLTQEAYEGLSKLFASEPSSSTYYRRRTGVTSSGTGAIFDGYQVVKDRPVEHHSEGISHALNTLALYREAIEWIDNRTVAQRIRTLTACNEPEHTHHDAVLAPDDQPTFNTLNEYRSYRNIHGLPDVRHALWSDIPLIEYDVDPTDPNYDPSDDAINAEVKFHTRRIFHYQLTDQSRSYYKWFADHYHMRPPTLNARLSVTSLISAVLEAIGTSWIFPPPAYYATLKEHPNPNKAHKRTVHKGGNKRLYGNHQHKPFTPDFQTIQPFTPERARILRQQMIDNGELAPDPIYTHMDPENNRIRRDENNTDNTGRSE